MARWMCGAFVLIIQCRIVKEMTQIYVICLQLVVRRKC